MRNRSVLIAVASARHPWRAIVGWFVFVAFCVGIGAGIGGKPAATEDFWIGEAGRGEAIATSGGLQQVPIERVLITGGGTAADSAARAITDRMLTLPEVESVAVPVHSLDGTVMRVDVTMAGAELDAKKHVAALREQTDQVQRAYPDLRVEQTGGPSISSGVEALRGRDLARTELIALPLTLITLLVVFRSAAMALVPLLLAISSIVAAIGLSLPASHLFPDNGVGTNIILLIGMAVGVDYTLFYLKRAREERARAGSSLSSRALVELAAATSGRAVVVSGIAVAVSSATMYLADDVVFSSIATAAILVTLVAVASSLTALPALLTVLTDRAERRAARKPSEPKRENTGRLTGSLLRLTAARPVVALTISVLAMLALTAPLLSLELTDMGPRDPSTLHPRHANVRSTQYRLPPAEVDASGRGGGRADARRRCHRRAARTGPTSRVRSCPRGQYRTAHLPVRTDYLPATVGALSDVDYAVTGDVARYADYPRHQEQKLPLIIATLLLVTFVLTVVAFRSVVLGLIGVVLNLLSAGAALGLLTAVFQHTWAEGLLDFHSTGSIGSRVPLLLFVILFGLSMDYQVFVLSRISELARAGLPTRQAVLEGVGGSASAVTSAAFVMVTVFASFVPLHIMEMKQMGFALAAAVLLDAFVIRIVILPAVLLLLGDRTWWPARPAVIAEPVKVG
ncbi:MMPL family transporter [Nocardia sp. XZ_19_231]|uniref:MMPL family transporter n=1 Tax=Nocardia sp. XZ_19_231 TaxID=2769252 RepID=UPI001E3BDF85|nr:MMPL family transporter [Nocardia sp. XZ_19_231]